MQPSQELTTSRSDMKSLVQNAQDLFREATTSTGIKADELRTKGMALLETAMQKAQDVQAAALETSKELASTADEYVQENPWRAVAVSATVGVLVGLLIARK